MHPIECSENYIRKYEFSFVYAHAHMTYISFAGDKTMF